jgi:hypothetical protein
LQLDKIDHCYPCISIGIKQCLYEY